MSAPLNLASRPFRNERLPTLSLLVGILALVALTVQHAFAIQRLLPSHTTVLHREAAALEREAAELRKDGAALRGPGPDRVTLARFALLKELVDRRTFEWTGLLARLESTLPRGVRLLSLQPHWEKGSVRLDLEAHARTPEDGFAVVRALEERPEFDDVFPLSKDESEGELRFQYSMRYLPEAAGAAAAPEAPSEEPVADAAADGDEP